ncbi:hypothetical protein K443DRAFT_8871 [Laccaria amethystina LaAM-08-1]|uniref:Uncharacterized protein n=1 Tax=Laccaria amethystina LaAM-08-1 TaxID=1095629 RepID=A0A0C9WN71_9AGAR|nr:hypothetical protein K443DRAFT_8871 [Laccaria amethystina LaAM-08-1]
MNLVLQEPKEPTHQIPNRRPTQHTTSSRYSSTLSLYSILQFSLIDYEAYGNKSTDLFRFGTVFYGKKHPVVWGEGLLGA